MTEKLQPLSTQNAIPSQTLFTANAPGAQDVPHKVELLEEEPYTIKCICNFSDDDGNTIYCETCDTWQHIGCYYPHNREEALSEEFAHSCVDCKPRHLDRDKAIERTARLRNATLKEETLDKKSKRPPSSKSQKKKTKPTDLQLNGNHTGNEHSKHMTPNDQPHPAKKAKTSHKSSHSISSQPAKRSPSYANSRNHPHGHPPSPANTPPDLPRDFEVHTYSPAFLSLYSDSSVPIVQNNSFASLTVSNTISLWLREPERMKQETGEEFNDVFQTLPADIDTRKRDLKVGHKKIHTPDTDTILRWQYLSTPIAIGRDVPLIELNGHVGFQKDYCADPDNLWEELSSPLPFVFFHPLLPLYIDTRKEGSLARYVRYSCKPNAVLDTFLSGGSEYHFWLVSDREIAANEQITLPWDFRLPKEAKVRMLHFLGDDESNGNSEPDMTESEYQNISGWVYRILSEYGGCACDLGSNCAFVRFHRQYHAKSQSRLGATKKKSRKKAQPHTISPTSTGHATNSRAASEGHPDDGPDNDGRSTSGSSRSKPPSRDLTPMPLRQGSFDQLGILTEPTDRDKRKVAMVEDSFRRMEQQQPPRKKKRTSDGTGSKPKPSRNNANGTTAMPNGGPHYVDASTSRSKSGSPASAVSPSGPNPFKQQDSRHGSTVSHSRHASVGPRANYCDASVQTDPVEGEWYSEPGQTPKTRRRIISLSQRLLNSRHRLRVDEEVKRKASVELASPDETKSPETTSPVLETTPLDGPSQTSQQDESQAASTSQVQDSSCDMPMSDAPSGSPVLSKPAAPGLVVPSPTATSPIKPKSPELRVQMPPVPAFNSPNSTASSTNTPLSASGSLVQSPFSTTNLASPFGPPSVNGVTAQPSPVKKKLSLSDYTKSRMNKTAGGKPAVGPNSLRTSTSNLEDSKTVNGSDSTGASPTGERITDGLANGTSALSNPAPAALAAASSSL
jgi:uncharacterized protein